MKRPGPAVVAVSDGGIRFGRGWAGIAKPEELAFAQTVIV